MNVLRDVRKEVEGEMDVVREGVQMSRDRSKQKPLSGIERIAAERQRQINVEGWTPEHDDEHGQGEIALAAASYLLNATNDEDGPELRLHGADIWPWDDQWWKPSADPIRDLEKAGALIAAEIDRRQRLQNRTS